MLALRGELEGLPDRVGQLLTQWGIPLQEAEEQLTAQVQRVAREGLGVLQASVPIPGQGARPPEGCLGW